MSYDVSFKAKLEGMDQWVAVGPAGISITSNAGNMIKEVCGSYPSEWEGKRCSDMYSVLMQGASLLHLNPSKYRIFEIDNRWGTVGCVHYFLSAIADVCDKYPVAVIEVNY